MTNWLSSNPFNPNPRKGEVIPSKRWEHKVTGATASPYGAVPWTGAPGDRREDWELKTVGWTIRWSDGTVGTGRVPFKTQEEAQRFLDERGLGANPSGSRPPEIEKLGGKPPRKYTEEEARAVVRYYADTRSMKELRKWQGITNQQIVLAVEQRNEEALEKTKG